MANYVLTQTGQEVQDILDSMGATYFFSQSVSSWTSDNTYADYPYKGTISLVGVDGTMGVEVTFSNDQAISGNYSPICNTTNDAVEIWSKVNTSITIPTIKIYKNGYVNLNGSSNYMPQSGGNFTGAISVNNNAVLDTSNIEYSFPISSATVSVPSGSATVIGSVSLPRGISFVQMGVSFTSNATGYRQVLLSEASDLSTSYGAVAMSRTNAVSGVDTIINMCCAISLSSAKTIYIGAVQNSGSSMNVFPRVKVVSIKM